MDNLAMGIFTICTVVGVGYFLFVIFFGDLGDTDVGMNDGEFSLLLVAGFSAGFGAFGMLGMISGWTLGATLVVAAAFGYLFGKSGSAVLRFVMRQQTLDSIPQMSSLVGMSARITVNSPAGKTGEAMLENADYVTRSPVKEVNGEALQRGDIVQVVSVESGMLYVKKKNA